MCVSHLRASSTNEISFLSPRLCPDLKIKGQKVPQQICALHQDENELPGQRMLSWVTMKNLTCLTDVTQGKRYVDAHQEQIFIIASWNSMRDKGIYQQFNYSRNTL